MQALLNQIESVLEKWLVYLKSVDEDNFVQDSSYSVYATRLLNQAKETLEHLTTLAAEMSKVEPISSPDWHHLTEQIEHQQNLQENYQAFIAKAQKNVTALGANEWERREKRIRAVQMAQLSMRLKEANPNNPTDCILLAVEFGRLGYIAETETLLTYWVKGVKEPIDEQLIQVVETQKPTILFYLCALKVLNHNLAIQDRFCHFYKFVEEMMKL